MNYKTFDDNGKLVSEGELTGIVSIPTHGSISIQVGDKWLSLLTSEWMILEINDKPFHWRNQHDANMRRFNPK